MRDLDLCGKALDLLRLDRAVDPGKHLALTYPVAGIDRHRDDTAALAHDADRHFTPRGERAGRGDFTFDRGPPRTHHGNRGRLRVFFPSGGRRATTHGEIGRNRETEDDKAGDDDDPAAIRTPFLETVVFVGIEVDRDRIALLGHYT